MSASATVLAGDSDTLAGRDRRRFAAWFARSSLRFGSYVAFAVVLLVFAWRVPSFLSVGNIGNILGQSAILGVLAFGMTIVIIGGGSNIVTGGIDLSLAANMGLSAAIYAALVQAGSAMRSRRRGRDRYSQRILGCRTPDSAAARDACRDEHRGRA